MDDWAKVVLGGLIGAVGVAGAGFATGYFSLASKNEELRVHLVEIAFGILRADPKEGVSPARGWAIEVIEKDSGVTFSKEDREALLSKPILDKDFWLYKKGVGDLNGNGHIVGGDPSAVVEQLKRYFEDQDKADKAAPPK